MSIQSIGQTLPVQQGLPNSPVSTEATTIKVQAPKKIDVSTQIHQDANREPIPEKKKEAVQEIVQNLNETIKNLGRNVKFSVDEKTGHSVIQVLHSETGKLIRQIPSEEFLAISQNLEKLKGLILSAEA